MIGIFALVLVFPITTIFAGSSEFTRFSLSMFMLGLMYGITGLVISIVSRDNKKYSDPAGLISIVALMSYVVIGFIALATK